MKKVDELPLLISGEEPPFYEENLIICEVKDNPNRDIRVVARLNSWFENTSMAALIVSAVNSHESLLDEVERLREALGNLLHACEMADEDGDLSMWIDGELLDKCNKMLKRK
jgi:hypothetical protein